jgi:hypothetical protein
MDWIQRLDDARQGLQDALKARSADKFETHFGTLVSILRTQPSQINNLMQEAARNLPLSRLVEAMVLVRDELVRLGVHLDKVDLLSASIRELQTLHATLTQQIRVHDECQGIDVEIRRVEFSRKRFAADLQDSWPELKSILEPLYTLLPGQWVDEVKAVNGQMDQKLAALAEKTTALEQLPSPGDPRAEGLRMEIKQLNADIKPLFKDFRTRVTNRFYKVDADLNEQCGQLQPIGRQLAKLLEKLR